MAEISGNIAGLSWLHPKETPLDALLKGAQVGNIIADNMAQRQALGMQAAMLPSRIQALATHNKLQEAQLAEEWKENKEKMVEREAWQRDLVTTEPFMTETDPDKLAAMPIPVARTARGQTAVHNRALAASQHQVVKARTAQYTELNKQAAEVFDGGETLTPVKDAHGVTTYDPGEIAAKKLIIAERVQAGKIALEDVRGDNRIDLEIQRQFGRENLLEAKAAIKEAADGSDKIIDQAIKATYLRRMDIIKSDAMIDGPEKIRQLRKLAQEFNLQAPQFPSRGAAAAPATAKPSSSGYIQGKSYGGMTYLGGDPNQRSSWK